MFDGSDLGAAAAARAEWRAEEESWIRAAHERWEHGRSLVDVVRDCMHRGDRVTFVLSSTTVAGAVVAVGTDVARVATVEGAVDVAISSASPVVVRVAPGRNPGTRGDGTVTTFAARLRELDGAVVDVAANDGDELRGRLRRGRDHVRVDDGDRGSAYVPIGSVVWVRPVDVD